MAIMEHVNGTRGRTAPALPTHTFKDSGITIRIRKVGPATQQRLAQQIQKDIPKPDPPMITTELGVEPNPADPTYAAAIAEWNQQQGLALNHRLMTLAALESEVEIGPEETAQIARARRNLQLMGVSPDDPAFTDEENDRVLYVLHIACVSPEDLKEFASILMSHNAPTEAAVQSHIETFPGDLPGAERL